MVGCGLNSLYKIGKSIFRLNPRSGVIYNNCRYNINSIPNYTGKYPDKYYKILDAWKLLDLKAEKNYYKK